MAFFCVGNFSSCSSSDDNDGEGQLDTPQYAADAAKYEITDESSEVKSIELTESGQYIVIMNMQAEIPSRLLVCTRYLQP